jgi:putative addiction module component (TIGR02574 family)
MVFDLALSLPEGERAQLAYRLMQSLKPPAAFSAEDPTFEDELERRADAYEAGETSAADWDTAAERLRQAFESRKSE